MEFKEAMRIFNRICKEREKCEGCVLENKCIVLKNCDYSTVEAILAKWAAEHPERTRLDDFLDKHPRAPLDDNDTPRACAKHLGYCAECMSSTSAADCDDCWRQPLEEVEG